MTNAGKERGWGWELQAVWRPGQGLGSGEVAMGELGEGGGEGPGKLR